MAGDAAVVQPYAAQLDEVSEDDLTVDRIRCDDAEVLAAKGSKPLEIASVGRDRVAREVALKPRVSQEEVDRQIEFAWQPFGGLLRELWHRR